MSLNIPVFFFVLQYVYFVKTTSTSRWRFSSAGEKKHLFLSIKKTVNKIWGFQSHFDWYFCAGGHANTFFVLLLLCFTLFCFASVHFTSFQSEQWRQRLCPFMNVTGFYSFNERMDEQEHRKIYTIQYNTYKSTKWTVKQKNYLELRRSVMAKVISRLFLISFCLCFFFSIS